MEAPMTINFTTPENNDHLQPRITVVGCGGAGGNAVNNMISKQLEGVEFVVANTDAQALSQSLADRHVQLGREITHGLGAGSRPDMGRAAAEEALEDIGQILNGSHMVFIAAGMGGGTGTGAAPVIARLAREQGMLTVGVVTKPFQFEGSNRMRIADTGIEEMQQFVDTLIVIPNQNLFRIANEKTTFADAFAMADDVLHSGVRGVTDLMVVPGLINLDFADIRSVMSEMGKAMMGTGEADGEERAKLAAEAAISNPLLDDVSMKGARGVLINITGGPDMTLFEVDEAANRIGDEVDADANIIFGSALDQSLEGRIRVSVVATGIDIGANTQPRPVLKVYSDKTEAKFVPINEPNLAKTNINVPTTATSMPTINGGSTATALKMSESIPTPEEPNYQQGQLEMKETPVQTDIVNLVESENQMEKIQQPSPTGVTPNFNEPHTKEEKDIEKNEHFIPPVPSEPIKTSPAKAINTADPFREAEFLNAAPAPEKRKSPNIFQRMTGTSWSKKENIVSKSDSTVTSSKKLIEPNPEEKRDLSPKSQTSNDKIKKSHEPFSENPIEPKIPLSENKNIESDEMPGIEELKTEIPNKKVQPNLQGGENQKILPNVQSEEDLLEIPAFLRRQAN